MNSISSWLVHRDRGVDEWAVELPCAYLPTHSPTRQLFFQGRLYQASKQASKQTTQRASLHVVVLSKGNESACNDKQSYGYVCLYVCMHLEFEERVKQKKGESKALGGVMNHLAVTGTRGGQLFFLKNIINDGLIMYTLHTI